MKVLFDHQIFSLQAFGGVSKYFYELMNNFQSDNQIDYELSLKYSTSPYLVNLDNFYCRSILGGIEFRGKNRLYSFFNKNVSRRALLAGSYDIFHPTYYDPYFLDYLAGRPFVLTIFDMTYEIFAGEFFKDNKVARAKQYLALKARKIIAISENTKEDIIKSYKIDENKIEVIYLAGFNPSSSINTVIKNNLKLPKEFILFVGKRQGYKNFHNFIKAISPLLLNNPRLFVVCVGGGRFSRDEQELLKDLSIDRKVIQLEIDGEQQMRLIYKKAAVFVFPSLYEGFGIPILESFECGCPVAISNTGSFPEVAKDAAEYFDPRSIDSIKSALERLITSHARRQDLVKSGLERVRNFSWQVTARKTKEVYSGIVNRF